MPLTAEQIVFEKDWASRYADAISSMDLQRWLPFHKETTTIIRPLTPVIKGIKAIEQLHANLMTRWSAWKITDLSIVVDEENNRIVCICNSWNALKFDPERKEIPQRNVMILTKKLGLGEETVDVDEAITDPSPFLKRLGELGIDPSTIVGHTTA